MPTAQQQSNAQSARAMLPMQTRAMPISSFDPETNEFDCVWAAGAQVRRYDYRNGRYFLEELSMEPGHVDLSRLNGGAPLLDSHWAMSMECQVGKVVEGTAKVTGGQGLARCKLSARESVAGIRQDVGDGIIKNMSVGYSVRKYLITEPQIGSNELPVYRAIDWVPAEVSLVPIGADPAAGIRSYTDKRGEQRSAPEFECEFVSVSTMVSGLDAANSPQERSMTQAANSQAASNGPANATTVSVATVAAPASDTRTAEQIAAHAVQAERQRIAYIQDAVRTAGLDNGAALEQGFINSNTGIDAVRAEVFNLMRQRNAASEVRSAAHIEVVGDNSLQQRTFMTEAIAHRLNPSAQLSDGARQFRYMSLRELAASCLEAQGVRTRGMTPLELATRAMHTTSDFSAIMANVMGKRLRAAYQESQPTYRIWARRAPNAPDFKQIQVTQLGAMPDLLEQKEGDNIKYGTASDGKEVYSVVTYARGLVFSRQMLINDDLRAFDRAATGFAGSAARLENRLVYQQITGNPTLGDGVALFHATHGNLAGAGAAIDATTLKAGRAGIRKQKGLAGEELNLSPRFLLAGSDSEQLAYQYTSSNYVPAKAADVNEFRQGGRTELTPVIDAVLDSATAWYLAADSAAVDTVEYCYLDGSEGVFIDSAMDFDSDGMKVKARLDFAAKVIDFRGFWKNPGA